METSQPADLSILGSPGHWIVGVFFLFAPELSFSAPTDMSLGADTHLIEVPSPGRALIVDLKPET
jgi:hypothetical protein